jgi:predicted nucleic acid-binding protein
METTIADTGFIVALANYQYQGSRLDFVDATVMAVAECLSIQTILTFDH